MARRPGSEGVAFDLSPRAMRIAGWIAAAVIILGIAIVVGLLGGDADSGPIGSSPSASTEATAAPIEFGTSLDPTTGMVADGADTDRFTAGDSFAYSVATSGTAPDPVYVEVRRTGGGAVEVVQTSSDGHQPLEYPPALAFDVPADNLFAVFGPGEYLMLIYADPAGDPIAEGTFVLVGPDASPAASRVTPGRSPAP
jgi:hypothetical protein